jgi:RNA-directed DNA polymerase
VRYTDDCSIYVRSNKSAQRVMRGITKFIEEVLKLKVNKTKSEISRPSKSTLLGFSFYKSKTWLIRIASKSIQGIRDKIRDRLKRNDPKPLALKLREMRPVIIGWINYFMIAEAKSIMIKLDELLRTRACIITWHQWKRIKTKIRNLIKLGVHPGKAYEWGNSSKGVCRVAHSPVMKTTISNQYLSKQGLISFQSYYPARKESQQKLF